MKEHVQSEVYKACEGSELMSGVDRRLLFQSFLLTQVDSVILHQFITESEVGVVTADFVGYVTCWRRKPSRSQT